jgi:hypothetical protein
MRIRCGIVLLFRWFIYIIVFWILMVDLKLKEIMRDFLKE